MKRRRRDSKKQLVKRGIAINTYILPIELRVLDDENGLLGVMHRDEALKIARERGVDLVEIAPKAAPPVAKVISFNKYLYQLAKKSKNEKKGKTETKEIKIGLFVADHDMERLAKRTTEFIKEGHQVRVSLWLKGRELGKKEQAKAVLMGFAAKVKNGKVSAEPVLHGKVLRIVISFEKKQNEQAKNEEIISQAV